MRFIEVSPNLNEETRLLSVPLSHYRRFVYIALTAAVIHVAAISVFTRASLMFGLTDGSEGTLPIAPACRCVVLVLNFPLAIYYTYRFPDTTPGATRHDLFFAALGASGMFPFLQWLLSGFIGGVVAFLFRKRAQPAATTA